MDNSWIIICSENLCIKMHTDNKITLLSPARDISVAKAAIQAGADAVYIGAPKFGARQAAGNSLQDLQALADYAHTYGVKVLVTLNTLLHEDEYADAVALAHDLYRIGVDALIIQDLHLLDYDLPPIRLHASTQCDNRTPEQVIRLQRLGFRRVVLARELGIEEIRAIRDAVAAYSAMHHETPIELEAFIHGALCVSYSGRCYMSEALLGRSANRGCCAQMCRMQYDLLDADMQEIRDDHGQPIHQRYLLSLQDMDRSAHIAELIEAGVTTFKIEGRLKDADYVTNLTAYYRQKIDSICQFTNLQTYKFAFAPSPAKTFHRGGTDYFLHRRTPRMANWQTPKSTGEYIGEAVGTTGNALRLRLADGIVLHNGDGICFGDRGFAVNRIEGDLIYPNTPAVLPLLRGKRTALYRNLDTEFVRTLHAERHIPIDIVFRETADGFALRLGDTEQAFTYSHEPAKNPERALETIRTQLTKLGDTPFAARSVEVQSAPYFIPIGQLNEWRREAIQRLITRLQTANRPAPDNRPQRNGETEDILRTLQAAQRDTSYPLMTCRYCLLHELEHCRKQSPMPVEPRYLRLRNNTLVALTFDCRHCRMLLTKDSIE